MIEHDIRYTFVTDISYLKSWLQDPETLKWFPMSEGFELEQAAQCWISFSKWSCSLTATVNHVPCGIATLFLMPYKKVAHHSLAKIVVDPQKRHLGLGSSLIKNLKHLAKTYFHLEMLAFEVWEGNPLIPLLEKQGFRQVFRQEGFAKINGEAKARVFMESVL